MHPRCRCTVCAALGENLPVKRKSRISERREKISGGMTYDEWKNRYVEKDKTQNEPIPTGLPFKRQSHFSTSDENVRATNPNYSLGIAYQQNCQRCVPTYEMRMRGYDVVARPTFDLDTDSFAKDYWDKIFDGATIEENLPGSGKEYVINRMLNWGVGARGEVYVVWRSGEAHVFVAENRNGVIHFLDPQTGELDVEHYFENVQAGLTRMFRIDNLDVNEKYIKWFCKELK